MYTFDEEYKERLRRRLRALDKPRRLAFAIACAERAFGPYRYYARQAYRGHPRYLRSTLNSLWELVLQRQIGHKLPFLDDGERLIPLSVIQADKEIEEACLYKEPHELDILADDPVCALLYACRCELRGDVQSAVWAATRDYELVTSIALHLDQRAKRKFYRAHSDYDVIDQLDYVQNELQQQVRDLEDLTQCQAGNGYVQLIRSLRSRAQRQGRTLQGIVMSLTNEI